MIYPAGAAIDPDPQPAGPAIEKMGADNAPEMVALTTVAFPGYFRAETYRMGAYYGIRIDGALIAMAGERVALPGCREISAVCTHPEHVGRGYAARLIRHILRDHAAREIRSFLHLAAANHRAFALYDRLGFVKTRDVLFNRLRRADC
jgi:predicted GNAT family acetyltransferase